MRAKVAIACMCRYNSSSRAVVGSSVGDDPPQRKQTLGDVRSVGTDDLLT